MNLAMVRAWWYEEFKCADCGKYKTKGRLGTDYFHHGGGRFRCKDCDNIRWHNAAVQAREDREANRVILGKCNFCGQDVEGDKRFPSWDGECKDPKGGLLHFRWCPGTGLDANERAEIIKAREERARIDALCDAAWEKNRG